MQSPQPLQKDSFSEKHQAYDLAAAIERESGHRLTALPCDDGNGIVVSDGRVIHLVEPTEISSPKALQTHVKFWLTGNLSFDRQSKPSHDLSNDIEPEL